jgi:hypothetical protein
MSPHQNLSAIRSNIVRSLPRVHTGVNVDFLKPENSLLLLFWSLFLSQLQLLLWLICFLRLQRLQWLLIIDYGASFGPTSQVLVSVSCLISAVGNKNVSVWGRFQCHNVVKWPHQHLSSCSRLETYRQTDGQTHMNTSECVLVMYL